VNNDGKPNLNNSNAENENDARLAVWCTGVECGKKEVVSPETDALRKTAQGEY